MKMILKNGSSTPLFQQIKDGIKENIVSGRLKDGEQLPSVRVLSKELKVSILTVKKAYDELFAEGFIEVRQGLGTFVGSNNLELVKEEKQKILEERLMGAIKISKEISLKKREFMELVDYLYEGEQDGE